MFFVVIFALSSAGSIFVAGQVQANRLDDRLDAELTQETEELRQLAQGTDPETAESFDDDTRRIFEVFLSRLVPSPYEAMIAFPLDGEGYLRTTDSETPPLDSYPELLSRWRSLEAPQRERVTTDDGQLEYLAVTLDEPDGTIGGVFVVVVNRTLAARELVDTTRTAAAVALAALVIGGILVWSLAGELLAPIRRMTHTARSISESDLTQRLEHSGRDPSAGGKDQISELAGTFNAMLDRLESAFETQRQFVHDAGHELRTPITIVRGHIELLDHTDPADRDQTVALVLDELDRMHRFVEDLLLLAKAEQPDFLQLDAVDLGALTHEIARKCRAIAPRDWTVASTGRGVVTADRQRLTQATMQLAQNAVDHTASRTPIEIGSRVVGTRARLWVRDEGGGIPPDQHERVFERFSRGGEARRSSGAGLGLSIVKAIAEAHGGWVELFSSAGAGATFTLSLPVDPPVEPVDTQRPALRVEGTSR